MTRRALGAAALAGILLGGAPGVEPIPKIPASWISAPIRFLSDARLEGRETAGPGAHLAATYIATEFESIGLVPAPGMTGYLQRMPLRKSSTVTGSASVAIIAGGNRQELVLGKDFVVHADKVRDRVDVQAPAVFAGFGVTDSARGYDDYAGIDARGKLVLTIPGGPGALPSDERGHYSLLGSKEANALAHGAAGIVSLFPLPVEVVQEKVNRQLDGFAWLDGDGKPHTLFFELGATIRLTESGVNALFAAAGKSVPDVLARMSKGSHEAFDLPVELAFKAEFKQADTASENVVGMLRGSDPKLRDEYVVHTAHLDHVGVGPPVNGDSVFHGALDNAGGTAVVIALARAYASLPKPPRRSILFVAVSGEEKGILGSDYFSAHPPVPLERIVADVNMDNYLMLYPVNDLAAYGAGYSTLGDVVGHAFARLGLKLSADPAPEQTIFTRSDHYPFMRRGVPAVMLFTGIGSGDGTRDGSAVLRDWLRTVHHTPRDRIDQGIDWGAGVTYAQANFLIGNEVANAPARPRWRGRYFFGGH